MRTQILAEERAFYEEHFDEYSKKYPGRHLLICGRKLQGHFATREEAVAAGYQLGVQEMLVRESGTRERESFLPTLLGG